MATEKEDHKSATVVEEVSHGSQAVGVLDLDARIQDMARECPPFYKNHNLLILYLLVSGLCFAVGDGLASSGGSYSWQARSTANLKAGHSRLSRSQSDPGV